MIDQLKALLDQAGYRRIILLGRLEDMRGPELKQGLARRGFQVLVPPASEQQWLEQVIVAACDEGWPSDADKAHFSALVAQGADHGVDALVLLCPELRRLADACELAIPAVDAFITEEGRG